MMKLVLSLLAVAYLLRADFDVQRWESRRLIQVQDGVAVSAIVLDALVYRHSRSRLNDLRIIRADSEVPYQLQAMFGSQEEVELRPTLLNKAVTSRAGVQAVLDLNGHSPHNRLRLITGQKNFKEAVRVEASEDGRDWALVRDDGFIFDISREDRHVSDLTIEYPVSTRRYLRLTVPGWDDPSYLQSVWIVYRRETGAVRDVMATLMPILTNDPKLQTTSLLFDIGFEGLAYDHLELSVGPGMFFRDVEAFVGNDKKQWSFAGGGVVSRTAEREQLSLQIPEQWSRYLKLVISNGDDPPLLATRLTLSGVRRIIKFPSVAAGPYWLYSGNIAAKAPSYDFARITPYTVNGSPAFWGKAESNVQYRAPTAPWTDRHSYTLNAVLIVAVAAMGYISWRFLTNLKAA
jgi:Protein of unknown function (DUF3999)